MAAQHGHYSTAEVLLRNGADVNAKDMLKMTALHWATEHNHRDVVALLLKYGADVHAFSKFDKSAFDIALDKNNPETLLMLQTPKQPQVGIRRAQHENSFVSTMTLPNSTTSVLAALAAIAEASGPLSSSNRAQVVSEEVVETSAMERGAGGGAQRVITIVADGSSLGHLQAGLPGQGLGQPFIVTMQNGQQVLTLPAGQVAEEMEEEPPLKRIKVEHVVEDAEESKVRGGEGLQGKVWTLRPNQKAQEYRSRLMRKEQEAEKYRQRLEAMACPPDSGTETSAEDGDDGDGAGKETMGSVLEGELPTDIGVETVIV
uniref:GA binding protein transcription factor subunit beta 2 n=1 Tax=Anolis carolinensis TaxID=28377 RepID=A0A803T3P0_ANOCA